MARQTWDELNFAERWILNNERKVYSTCARLLVSRGHFDAANLLVNGHIRLEHTDYDNWDGGQYTFTVTIEAPPDYFDQAEAREKDTEHLNAALSDIQKSFENCIYLNAKVVLALVEDDDWRNSTRRSISHRGVNNQGRVRSDRVAPLECEGLLFRSKPEMLFYKSVKRLGIPVLPLPVVVQGGMDYQRIEPDFLIIYHYLVFMIEIDGDTYHQESPAQAAARDKFVRDHGVIVERIDALSCNTEQKATEAAKRFQQTAETHRKRGRP